MTYTLPHSLDRPGQAEAFDWIMNNKKRFLIIQAPTGSGKSAWAAAASITHKVLTLVETKSLQSTNYKDSYNFDILYGKSNYPCEDEKKGKRLMWTAFDCGNPDCDCPYNRAEERCTMSQRVSLNYSKFLLSGQFVADHRPDILFLDEAHNLPGITMDFAGVTVRWDNEFIRRRGKPKNTMQLTYFEAMSYFRQCLVAVTYSKPDREKDLKRWRKWKRLKQKLEMTAHLIGSREPRDWYFEVNEQRLLIKPLTAKYQFLRLFDRANKIVLMSATINPSIAEKLGIEDFDFYSVPNPWPAPARLIYDLDAPRMNFSCSNEDRDKQAKLIALACKDDKSGIIHVSSKWQAKDLSERLFELGVQTWQPTDGIGTDKQLEAWYSARQPGLYCISWCFHEGVDLGGDDICIIAKVPYAALGEPYEKAKADYDSTWYREQAAYRVEQAAGRTRRGKPEHYTPQKAVYIADGSWKGLKRLLSQDFLKAIRAF